MQMGSHALALVWRHELEENPYFQNEQVLRWCVAGFEYALELQNKDGSWDEWYPNERGWAGPTGYILHALAQTSALLGNMLPKALQERFQDCAYRAALHLIHFEEEHVLANHHAVALLPLYEACLITKRPELFEGYERMRKRFESFCHAEGWCLEYDGADIGYLAGTIGFLARLEQCGPQPWIASIVERGLEFVSYHVYPDGSFGGTMGSRQTSHYYPMGFEYWAGRFPVAGSLAEKGLQLLSEGKLIEPAAHEDHYIFYRVPEFIEAYLAHKPRSSLPTLPHERAGDFEHYFKAAGILVKKTGQRYWALNLAKGGVIKGFDLATGKTLVNDSGWLARTVDHKLLTPQWNDSSYEIEVKGDSIRVKGRAHFVVTKYFSPAKLVVFRLLMGALGANARAALYLKSLIRRLLMVGMRPAPVLFERSFSFTGSGVKIDDTIKLERGTQIESLVLGGEFFVRYVPQSRYFHVSELEASPEYALPEQLAVLNRSREFRSSRRCAE